MINQTDLEIVATACRCGLSTLGPSQWSMFSGFPKGACGPASEIIGRLLKEFLQYEGFYVIGSRHRKLEPDATHAWFEVGEFVIDITYDQFPGTGLKGWVFQGKTKWHSQFRSLARRTGFSSSDKWECYPHDGYDAAIDEIQLQLATKLKIKAVD